MSDTQLATAAISVSAWFLGASPVVAGTLADGEAISDLAIMWLALGPGCLGGLAMQIWPDYMKSPRQLVAELIMSMGAAVIVIGMCRASITDVMQLGGIAFLSGVGGSIFIIAWVQIIKKVVADKLRALFGVTDE